LRHFDVEAFYEFMAVFLTVLTFAQVKALLAQEKARFSLL
jgi:hypothetical protein